jgi:hypothetical protein
MSLKVLGDKQHNILDKSCVFKLANTENFNSHKVSFIFTFYNWFSTAKDMSSRFLLKQYFGERPQSDTDCFI